MCLGKTDSSSLAPGRSYPEQMNDLLHRIEKLESSQRRWRFTAVSRWGAVAPPSPVTTRSAFHRSSGVERGGNGGAILAKLGESPQGGRMELYDAQGKVRLVMDADGIRTLDAEGKEKRASPR